MADNWKGLYQVAQRRQNEQTARAERAEQLARDRLLHIEELRADVDELRERLLSAQGFQPIETAPKRRSILIIGKVSVAFVALTSLESPPSWATHWMDVP